MARTLHGFDAAYPYLGGRGDVSDASLIDKEEAYGQMYDPGLAGSALTDDGSVFGAISERVANEMFGAGRSGWLFRR